MNMQVARQIGTQRRAAVRVDVDRMPVEVWIHRFSVCHGATGVIVNLSAGGALIELADVMPIGQQLRCRFSLPSGPFFSISAVVARVRPMHTNRWQRLTGIQFTFNQDGRRDLLVRWVFAEIARRQRTWMDATQ